MLRILLEIFKHIGRLLSLTHKGEGLPQNRKGLYWFLGGASLVANILLREAYGTSAELAIFQALVVFAIPAFLLHPAPATAYFLASLGVDAVHLAYLGLMIGGGLPGGEVSVLALTWKAAAFFSMAPHYIKQARKKK